MITTGTRTIRRGTRIDGFEDVESGRDLPRGSTLKNRRHTETHFSDKRTFAGRVKPDAERTRKKLWNLRHGHPVLCRRNRGIVIVLHPQTGRGFCKTKALLVRRPGHSHRRAESTWSPNASVLIDPNTLKPIDGTIRVGPHGKGARSD